MSFISKIIELCLVAQSLSALRLQAGLLLRSAASILVLVAMAFVFGFMAILCLYAGGYLALTEQAGLMPLASVGILFGVSLCFLIAIIVCLKKKGVAVAVSAQRLPSSANFMGGKQTVTNWGFKIMHSFLDGLETGRPSRRRSR